MINKIFIKKLLLVFLILLFSVFTHADEKTEENSNKWKIIPIPGIAYTEDTGLLMALAVTAFEKSQTEQNGDSYSASARYSLENMYGFSFSGSNYLYNNTRKLLYKVNLSNAVNDFYGVGIETEESSKEKYDKLSFNSDIAYLFRNGNFSFGPQLLFYSDEVSGKEQLLSSENYSGSEGITQTGGGIILRYDTRDSSTDPLTGVYYNLTWNSYSSSILSDYSYNYFKADLRQFNNITGDHVLGFNAVYEQTAGDIPFQMLPALGGSSILRGFSRDRYIDKIFSGVQAEYRFPISGPLGGVFFAGTGTVFNNFNKISTDSIKSSAGGGIRFNLAGKQHINLRLDYSRSSENENKFLVTVMEAF